MWYQCLIGKFREDPPRFLGAIKNYKMAAMGTFGFVMLIPQDPKMETGETGVDISHTDDSH